MNEVADRLIRLVRELLGPEGSNLDPFPVTRQLSDVGITSLKMVNLMLAVETEFDISLSQSEITPENFLSLATVEALVMRTLHPLAN